MCSSLCWGTTSGWMTPLGNQRNSGPWSFLGSYNQHVSLAQGPVWSAREGTMDDWGALPEAVLKSLLQGSKSGGQVSVSTWHPMMPAWKRPVFSSIPRTCLQHQITIVVHRCWGDNLLWTIDCDVPDGGPIVFSFFSSMFNIQWKIIIMGWKLQPNLQLVSPKNPMDVISAMAGLEDRQRLHGESSSLWSKPSWKSRDWFFPNSLWNWQSWRKTLQNVVGMPEITLSNEVRSLHLGHAVFGDNGEILSLTLIASCPSSVNKYFFNFQTKFYSHQSNLLETKGPLLPLNWFQHVSAILRFCANITPVQEEAIVPAEVEEPARPTWASDPRTLENCLTNTWLRRRSVGVIQEHPCSWQ